MGDVVKNNQAWSVKEEVNEGSHVGPASANDFIQTLRDGAELNKQKELVERNVFTGGIGKVTPLTGMQTPNGSIPVEARSSGTEGGAPEYDVLMKSALGGKRSSVEITSLSGHTTSRIYVPDASLLPKHSIVLVKQAGAFHISPVIDSVVDDGEGDDYIDLLVPAAAPFANGVKIAARTEYFPANSGHKSFSVSRWLEGAVRQIADGCKVSGFSLEGFSTGQLPTLNFSFEGLSFDSDLNAIPYTPVYSSQRPPLIFSSCILMDGLKMDANNLAISLENTLGFKTSTCEANGRSGSRVTERNVTGSVDPAMKDDSIANFNKFKNNTSFSIFSAARIPKVGVPGEFEGIVAFYMPNCIITELSEGDQDGIMNDAISFSATTGDGSKPELIVTVI